VRALGFFVREVMAPVPDCREKCQCQHLKFEIEQLSVFRAEQETLEPPLNEHYSQKRNFNNSNALTEQTGTQALVLRRRVFLCVVVVVVVAPTLAVFVANV